MIVTRPTEQQIRSAQIVTLFDAQRPEFHLVVLDVLDRSVRMPRGFVAVDMPVDSTNADMVEHMLRWVEAVRCGG